VRSQTPHFLLSQPYCTGLTVLVHRAHLRPHPLKGAKTTLELWPPKPNEFEMAAVMSCCCFSLGTVSMSATSSTRLPCSHHHHYAIGTTPQQTCSELCSQSDTYTGERQLQAKGVPSRHSTLRLKHNRMIRIPG
jgi:hypothetical protein